MFYKLTRATVSIIRRTEAECIKEAERGFVVVGTCDKDGNLISSNVVFERTEPVNTEEADKSNIAAEAPKKRGRKSGE